MRNEKVWGEMEGKIFGSDLKNLKQNENIVFFVSFRSKRSEKINGHQVKKAKQIL
jgi:hypothetical protein